LPGQTRQGVVLTFDLEPIDLAIHDRQIDSRFTLADSEFMNHTRIGIAAMFFEGSAKQLSPNIKIAHRPEVHRILTAYSQFAMPVEMPLS
jgi:hypothetical protein